ncbi:hypothetical protein FXO37_17160 [Capsicum annuum]|nr:hypothetical protein FXO37_17160 [Capsicum annuum]
MKKKHCVVQVQLCRCVMSLETKGSSTTAIVIRVNNTSLCFTPRKFAIITGLNCGGNKYDFVFDEEVVFKNIELTRRKISKFEIPQQNRVIAEPSVNLDDDFQDLPPKQIYESSKKKQKVDSSTSLMKKPLKHQSHNVVDEHTQKRTPPPRITKKQSEEKESDQPHIDDVDVETLLQRFNPDVVQRLDKKFNAETEMEGDQSEENRYLKMNLSSLACLLLLPKWLPQWTDSAKEL